MGISGKVLFLIIVGIFIYIQPGMAQALRSDTDGLNANYEMADPEPEFPGGEAAMYKFIQQNFKYPIGALDSGTFNGTIVFSIIIQKDGQVTDIETKTRDILVKNEIIRIASLMPKWKPAMVHGKPVPYRRTIKMNICTH